MNQNNFQNKQLKYKNMFFTIKLCALFFFAIPIYQTVFDTTLPFVLNIENMFTSLLFILLLMLIWIFLDSKRHKNRIFMVLEIVLFFAMCSFAIYSSGGYQSYYKFLYLFFIVSYTIEFGIIAGLVVASCSSAALLIIDFVSMPQGDINKYFESDIALTAMFLIVAWVIGYYVKNESQRLEKLEKFANIDGLTGLYNHRYFHEYMKSVCSDKYIIEHPISLLIIDIDNFKSHNDMFGHQKGDLLIMLVSDLFRKHFGKDGTIFRYGGDEFCVVMLDRAIELAYNVAEALRKEVLKIEYSEKKMLRERISVSIGVSQLYLENDDYLSLVERADKALYKAKYLGKNRVELYSSIFDQFQDLEPDKSSETHSVKQLITTINSRDSYTYHHVERVVHFSELFAGHLELDKATTKKLIYSAYVHDLGKIFIPKDVLIKETPLVKEEIEMLRCHPEYSAQIAREFKGMEEIAEIVLQHHERYDGRGYPHGLKGTDILYLARILTIVDSFDAMTSKRPYNYKRSKSHEEAIEEFKVNRGTQFDPELTDKFIEVLEVVFNSTKFGDSKNTVAKQNTSSDIKSEETETLALLSVSNDD